MSLTMTRSRGRGNTKIEILFNPNIKEMLRIPQEITVNKNTIVEWVVKFNPNDSISFLRYYGFVNFRIYFEGRSPFEWVNKTLEFNRRIILENKISLAEGEASEEGEYKYGVEIIDPDKAQLYDEDPYLRVIPLTYL